ncbi:MerR family transcriptional regulator [Pseudomonas alliivorans]|uniref:MerR family transcriptional regulator n=1 Tax=Pseudomonas TaxID=286 RepID=UPI001621FF0B|nr:MerR family transcriptional regulator [Pseudomonas alliivorans]MBP0952606.1 MerR family transcriptional regulator [Pseudomonas alliivorans]MEE4309448.1 MerR family transcriptional regulator [Pseudomonas alliivorans]MEE4343719.1 MerR family transcriptional regulator [Pseudomonas alliivorans]MEE4574781.1 MerR family transcriptional regulator [Pseudomonas alliivorans]MEE4619072.1 MerR family transcriptional regulator [Pseudomonas alliivorans]
MTQSIDPHLVRKDPDQDFRQQELYPIREVARLTGVNPVTLRAWERRYGLIQPTRTESGHRLYSQSDIETVRSILDWIERGVAVSKIGKILARSESTRSQSSTPESPLSRADWIQWQTQLRQAIGMFDERRLEQLYGQIFSTCPLVVVFEDILMPLWREVMLNQNAFGHTSEGLFFDTFLRGRVLQRLQLANDPGKGEVLLAALSSVDRELELLVAGLLMGNTEVTIRVLAIGQPFEELSLVCERVEPLALVLFSNASPAADLPKRLGRLALTLECPLLLAGEVSHFVQEGLAGSPIACLGSDGRSMNRLLKQFLAGQMDS